METYDEIYGRMKNAYEHETGDSFNEVSDIAIRLKVLAGEIFKLQTNLEWWKRQMFAVSASGECLDKLASQRGIERKKAMKSTGEITFNISQPCSHDIIIPKGCVVATADLVPIRFVTTEDEEISAGNTLVSVYAEAEQAGSNGNIGLGCAVVPVSVPTEIETVTNREKFTGGCDAETDDELRKRIRDTYINTSNGTNAAYYEQLALTVDGVAKASAVGKVRGVGTVNVRMGADLASNSDYRKIISAVGLDDKVKKYPGELSGGEQQRVAIARALAKKPTVLFLDEPTGALDEKTGRQVLDVITKLQSEQGFTMIMVTHNINIAEMANTVIKVSDGKIAEVYKNDVRKSAFEIGW